MPTAATKAHGVLLKIGDGATPTEVFTTIAEVSNITGPGLLLEVAEVTNNDSPNGWKERIGTLLDGGEVTFTINYLPTNATHNATAGLIRDMKNRTRRNFRITFTDPGATTWNFAGLVTKFEPQAPTDGALTADVGLTPTGEPTLV